MLRSPVSAPVCAHQMTFEDQRLAHRAVKGRTLGRSPYFDSRLPPGDARQHGRELPERKELELAGTVIGNIITGL